MQVYTYSVTLLYVMCVQCALQTPQYLFFFLGCSDVERPVEEASELEVSRYMNSPIEKQ